jgi:transposase
MAAGQRQGGQRVDLQAFFISIGARYKRIRKRPRGKPSPQLYEYKAEKLQELEQKASEGRIDLFYADESHVCTEGYVPYGWQFRGEDVYIPSQKIARLNIFGMTTRDNRYEGFTSRGSITADKLADFLDRLSLLPRERNTVIVLDNASIHRSGIMKEMRPVWENRGLFLFYLPPYSPHLNIAETLWRVLKGKWIRPQDYVSTDSLFYATDRALASVGTSLFVNYSHYAA